MSNGEEYTEAQMLVLNELKRLRAEWRAAGESGNPGAQRDVVRRMRQLFVQNCDERHPLPQENFLVPSSWVIEGTGSAVKRAEQLREEYESRLAQRERSYLTVYNVEMARVRRILIALCLFCFSLGGVVGWAASVIF